MMVRMGIAQNVGDRASDEPTSAAIPIDSQSVVYVVSKDDDYYSGGHRIHGVFSSREAAEGHAAKVNSACADHDIPVAFVTALLLNVPIDYDHYGSQPEGGTGVGETCVQCGNPFPCPSRPDIT
jgi:hypothetical protein